MKKLNNSDETFGFKNISTLDALTILEHFTSKEYKYLVNKERFPDNEMLHILHYQHEIFIGEEEYDYCVVIRDFVKRHKIEGFFAVV